MWALGIELWDLWALGIEPWGLSGFAANAFSFEAILPAPEKDLRLGWSNNLSKFTQQAEPGVKYEYAKATRCECEHVRAGACV